MIDRCLEFDVMVVAHRRVVAFEFAVCDGGRLTVLVARVGIVQPDLVRAWRARQASGGKTLPPSVAWCQTFQQVHLIGQCLASPPI